MAQRAVVALLRRAISCYVEESDLEAQVLQGQVKLARLKLWPRTLVKGLCFSGGVGELNATWSWTSLLSSPVHVEISNVVIIVQPEHLLEEIESRLPTQPLPPDASSQSFLKRLKRRILDQLRVKVTHFHCRFELPLEEINGSSPGGSPVEKCSPKEAPRCCYGVAVGLSFGHLHTVGNPKRAVDGVHMEQSIEVESGGVYFEPLLSRLDRSGYMGRSRSSGSCAAYHGVVSSSSRSPETDRDRERERGLGRRHSSTDATNTGPSRFGMSPSRPRVKRSFSGGLGARVITWEVLNQRSLPSRTKFIALDLSPTVTVKRRSGQALTDWHDVELRVEISDPRFIITPEHFKQLPNLLRSLQSVKQEADSGLSGGSDEEFFDALEDLPLAEYFDTVSLEDRELLLADEGRGPVEGTLQLEVSLQCVSVSFPEVLLDLGFGCDCSLTMHQKGWEVEGRLNEILLSDATRDDLDRWEMCVTRTCPEDVALAAISVRSNSDPKYSLMLSPMNICLPPALLEALSGPLPQRSFSAEQVSASHATQGPSSLGHILVHAQEMYDQLEQLGLLSSMRGSVSSQEDLSLDFNVQSLSFSVGEPWLPGATLTVVLGGAGRLCTTGKSSVSGSLSISLDDEVSTPLLEAGEINFTCAAEAGGSHLLHCGPITVTCAVHKLVALMRAFKVCVTGIRQSFRRARQEQAAIQAWQAWQANTRRPSRSGINPGSKSSRFQSSQGKPCRLEVQAERLMLCIDDEDCQGQYNMQVEPLQARFHSKGASMEARCCDLNILINGEARGLLRVTRASMKWMMMQDMEGVQHKLDLQGAIEVHDQVACNVALFCPCLGATVAVGRLSTGGSGAGSFRGPVRSPQATPLLKMSISCQELHVDTAAAFTASIKKAVRRANDIMSSLSVTAVVFEERPFGILVEDTKITGVAGLASDLGVVPGSVIIATDPPADGCILDYLPVCSTPIMFIVKPPPFMFHVEASVTPWVLQMTKYSAKMPVQLSVEQAEVSFTGFELSNWRGMPSALIDEVLLFYKRAMFRNLPTLAAAAVSGNTDGTVAGTMNAASRVGGAVAGAAASSVANKTAAALASSANKAQELKGDIANRFGGVARSFLQMRLEGLEQAALPRRNQTFDDRPPKPPSFSEKAAGGGIATKVTKLIRRSRTDPAGIRPQRASTPEEVVPRASSLDSATARLSSNSGAAANSSLQLGSLLNDELAHVKESRFEDAMARRNSGQSIIPYHLSDIVAAGKEARGVEVDDSYKFGDFSRGLIAKMRRRSS